MRSAKRLHQLTPLINCPEQLSSKEYTYDTLEHYYYDVGPAI